MVDEGKGILESGALPVKEISTLRVIVGFVLTVVLTLLLIPFLFLGACMGIFTFGAGGWLVVGFSIVALLVLLAFKTKNPGIRVGAILMLLAAAALAIRIFGR